MSGIGGLVYFDERPAQRAELGRLIDLLAHRGPHGRGIWTGGHVGLAQRTLRPGVDEPDEVPAEELAGDGLVVVADARLDNQAELASALGLPQPEHAALEPTALIHAAYTRWGADCVDHLLGDFAFAVWDTRAARLFCARDHFGVRPFYYAVTDRALVFGSELKLIRASGEASDRLDTTRIADYLAGIFADNTSTFYEGIRRLPPGQALTVNGGREARRSRVSTNTYWTLDPVRESDPRPIDELVACFRDTFYEAVRCRMRPDQPLGVLLSGGLDSSSIAATLRDILGPGAHGQLHAYSASFDTVTECDESAYAEAALPGATEDWHRIAGDGVGPFSDVDRLSWHQDEPYEAPNLFMVWALCRRARDTGVRVVFDGYDGDTTLSHGQGYLHEMAIAGQWMALVTELRGLAAIDGYSPWKPLWQLYRHHRLRPLTARAPWDIPGRALRKAGRLLRRGDSSANSPASPPAAAAGGPETSTVVPFIHPDLARLVDVDERHRQWMRAGPAAALSGTEEHYRALTGCIQPFALEVYDRTAAAFSLEYAHPFWDKRLVELCLSLPPQLKLDKGWSRVVLRRAMEGLLPAEVAWRRSKVDFAPNLRHALTSLQREQTEELVIDRRLDAAADFVDVDRVTDAWTRLQSRSGEQWRRDLFTLWKALSLSLWLGAREASPS